MGIKEDVKEEEIMTEKTPISKWGIPEWSVYSKPFNPDEGIFLPLPDSLNCSYSFKRKPDGTIDNDDIRGAVWCAICYLYDHGFMTAKPLKVTIEEKAITNILNETHKWVTIAMSFDKMGGEKS